MRNSKQTTEKPASVQEARPKAAADTEPKADAKPKAAGEHLKPWQLDGLVLRFLKENADSGPHGPTTVAKTLSRSSGAISNSLVRPTKAKQVRLDNEKPRRYIARLARKLKSIWSKATDAPPLPRPTPLAATWRHGWNFPRDRARRECDPRPPNAKGRAMPTTALLSLLATDVLIALGGVAAGRDRASRRRHSPGRRSAPEHRRDRLAVGGAGNATWRSCLAWRAMALRSPSSLLSSPLARRVFLEALPRQLDPTRRWGIANVPPEGRSGAVVALGGDGRRPLPAVTARPSSDPKPTGIYAAIRR